MICKYVDRIRELGNIINAVIKQTVQAIQQQW